MAELSETTWESARQGIQQGLWKAAQDLSAKISLDDIEVMPPTEEGRGDWTTNLPFRLAKILRKSPKEIAAALVQAFAPLPMVDRMEAAGQGFINFWVRTEWLAQILLNAIESPKDFGRAPARTTRILLEFVSANPTGPLVVVNGRAAAWGDSLARLLAMAGYQVDREFYVNDAGVQVDRLGQAMAIRLAEMMGEAPPEVWPEGVYPGEYVRELAALYQTTHGEWSAQAKDAGAWRSLGAWAAERLRAQQEVELARFGVHFDQWFSEQRLREANLPQEVVRDLEQRGHLYESEGARWFRSTQFGDQKDYVVVKSDGGYTYIVPDVAYHRNKFERGYDLLIDLLGPDHHGYIGRMHAVMAGLGYAEDRLEMLIIQMVRLIRHGELVKMSKRGGSFVTLAELMDEVDVDAARWFFIERSPDTPMDFDLDLAQLKTQENPVYYVQYAGARIYSLLQAYQSYQAEDGSDFDPTQYQAPLEQALIRDVAKLASVIERAAEQRAPQAVCRYLLEMAGHFHAFYRQHRILEEAPPVRRARIQLIRAVLVALQQGMDIIGVTMPERM